MELSTPFKTYSEVPLVTLTVFEMACGITFNGDSGPISLPGVAAQLNAIEDERQRRLNSEHECYTIGDLARWFVASRAAMLAKV